ncbi:MAG: protein kinase [Byssovorax sp.]
MAQGPGPLPASRRRPALGGGDVTLGKRVAESLALVHQKGIIHRDLKPSNLFLPDGEIDRVKVLDFGIAWRGGAVRVTRAGTMIGTPGYMAPEQARSADGHAPSFALGCVLYSASGSPAFFAQDLRALFARCSSRIRSRSPSCAATCRARSSR